MGSEQRYDGVAGLARVLHAMAALGLIVGLISLVMGGVDSENIGVWFAAGFGLMAYAIVAGIAAQIITIVIDLGRNSWTQVELLERISRSSATVHEAIENLADAASPIEQGRLDEVIPPESVTCGSCGARLKVPMEARGRKTKCAKCGQPVQL